MNLVLSTRNISIILQNNLTVDYFPQYKSEYNYIMNHYKQYNQVPDLITFLGVFKEFEVLDVQESLDYLLSEIFKTKTENTLISTVNKISDLYNRGDLDSAVKLLSDASTLASETKHLDAIDILDNVEERYNLYIEKCSDFNKYYVTTGFKELDISLGGGIDRLNGYFVISARAGVGKTLIMVKMAAAAAEKGLTVGFYEGEMTHEKLGARYDALASHIPNPHINYGNPDVANEYKNYLDILKQNHKGKLYILTRDMVSDNNVTVDTLEAFVEKYNLDILFVDQISLLDDSHKARTFHEQAANISKDLKKLQTRKHIPIVVASQQNRGSIEEGKFAGTENLSLSDRIGQDATEVMFISKADDIMTFSLAKARDGCLQNVMTYQVDYMSSTFTYIPQENDKLLEDYEATRNYEPIEEDNVQYEVF